MAAFHGLSGLKSSPLVIAANGLTCSLKVVIPNGMATSGDLIKTVAEITGHPDARVTTYFRSLREAGLVTKGGRGPSAAKMTFRDAATLLTALMGSRFDSEPAAQIVKDFSEVRAAHGEYRTALPTGQETGMLGGDYISTETCMTFDGFKVPQLQGLPARHTIIDALASTIEAVADDALIAAAKSKGAVDHASYGIEIYFYGPQPSAGIEFTLNGNEFSYSESAAYLHESEYDSMAVADFEIRRRITWRTILAVANLIAGTANA